VTPPSFPPDIWERLRRLDHCCHVSVHGLYIEDTRHWEVIIRKKGDTSGATVRVRRVSMAEAILEAIGQAEAQGWPG
jgi:hypothetical protein